VNIFFAEKDAAYYIHMANMVTIGKGKMDSFTPTIAWARRQVQAEHSTLDMANIIIIDEVRSDVVSHMVRHTAYHPRHYVESKRPDWTGTPRPKDPAATRLYMSRWPVKSILEMARQRLCFKAMKETREWVDKVKGSMIQSDDVLMRAIGEGMVRTCEYRGKCPYGRKGCKYYEKAK